MLSLQIYIIRPSVNATSARDAARGRMSESARSRIVAARYGISAKSVRDIWNRKSWIAATEPLWTDEVYCNYLQCPPTSPSHILFIFIFEWEAHFQHLPSTAIAMTNISRCRRCGCMCGPTRRPAGSTSSPRINAARHYHRRRFGATSWRSSAGARAARAAHVTPVRASPCAPPCLRLLARFRREEEELKQRVHDNSPDGAAAVPGQRREALLRSLSAPRRAPPLQVGIPGRCATQTGGRGWRPLAL